MPVRPTAPGPVAVVGGALAGMAAAARLAKNGYPVTLFEARDVLGGRWAARALPGTDVLVDDAPGVVGFPAPWRDLFRKSGRPLETELARAGYALVPAPPALYRFASGTELVLPTDRGEQHEVLRRTYGPGPALAWRDLVDGLDGVWQTLRPLGLEHERDPGALTREVRRRLWSRRSVADLADQTAHPDLRALVRSVAYRQGSVPERTPALAAVDLSLARTFGRWRVEPLDGADGDTGRSSVLTSALADRLRLRRVGVQTNRPVTAVEPDAGGFVVRTPAAEARFSAVVLAVDPGATARLLRGDRGLRRRLTALAPALAPAVTHLPTDTLTTAGETVELTPEGVPLVTYHRRVGGTGVSTTHDSRHPERRAGLGVAADGFRGWARLPGTRTGTPGLVLAGPSSPAGPGASQVVLTGALAAYAIAGRPD